MLSLSVHASLFFALIPFFLHASISALYVLDIVLMFPAAPCDPRPCLVSRWRLLSSAGRYSWRPSARCVDVVVVVLVVVVDVVDAVAVALGLVLVLVPLAPLLLVVVLVLDLALPALLVLLLVLLLMVV